MKNYFIFLPDSGGYIDSRELGLHIPELPPIQRATERVERIIVPGRSGTLTKKQGENVYDSYQKSFDVIATDPSKIQSVHRLLRGNGKMIFSNELNFRYTVSFAEGWSFNRFFRQWRRATLVLEVFPFKESAEEKVYEGVFKQELPISAAGCEVEIFCDTELPCPFFAEITSSHMIDVFLNGIRHISTVNAGETNHIYVDNEHITIYGDSGKNMLPQTLATDIFPIYFLPGKNLLQVRRAKELQVRFRGWFF